MYVELSGQVWRSVEPHVQIAEHLGFLHWGGSGSKSCGHELILQEREAADESEFSLITSLSDFSRRSVARWLWGPSQSPGDSVLLSVRGSLASFLLGDPLHQVHVIHWAFSCPGLNFLQVHSPCQASAVLGPLLDAGTLPGVKYPLSSGMARRLLGRKYS